ncbi:chemotaxis protein CheA [bacterium BMS3Abin08]|nr:chemotaxis protein CheA [bacterium BMS3Abin08]
MDKHREAFRDEAYELLAELETSLLELEDAPEDIEIIGRVFRAMHTIKGSGAMFGFDDIAAFTHEIETVFDLVRNGEISVTKELIDLTLSARDHIRTMLDASDGGETTDEVMAGEIMASLKKLIPGSEETKEDAEGPVLLTDLIDEAIVRVLSENEEQRLRANIKKNKRIYCIDTVASSPDFDSALSEIKAKIKKQGELISIHPISEDVTAGTVRFKLLFASDKTPESLKAALGVMPEQITSRTGEDDFSSTGLPSSDTREESITYRIRFRPSRDIFAKGTNPVLLLDELRQSGKCKVVAQTDAIPLLEDFDPEACYTYWDVILTTHRGINAIKDVFIFVEDDSELIIDVIDDDGRLDNEAGYKRLGEILIERGDLTHEDLQKVLSSQKRIGEMLVDAGVIDTGKVQSALIEQQHVSDVRESRRKAESLSSIRVSSGKLDSLVDLVGELVTVQSRLSRTAAYQNDPELLSIAEEVERLTCELRDNTMSIRMLPIGTTFSKFRRLVRTLSNELGKEVVMTTEGAETELDKTVIERLNDPLVHLIRNSIDHGIELPGVREGSGKPRQGTVHLSAIHSGANVLIRIEDDGSGLNAGAIKAMALEKGLVSHDLEMTEKEVFALIFAPGFSTAKNVTGVSGRGVGMDVVKRGIEALRGSIDINSKKGAGTTITLKLPLTLAIIDGLLVKVAGEFFVLPLSIVEGCVELSREDVARAHGRHVANVRGELVPYICLKEHFMINREAPGIEQIVITEVDGSRVGFVVDNVIGEHQTVIKSLGSFYKDMEGVSGATILGDGRVALILDAPKLVQAVEREEAGIYSNIQS